MRRYAYLKEPLKCNKKQFIYKIMIHKDCGGYYLYEYCSIDAVQCTFDAFYDSIDDIIQNDRICECYLVLYEDLVKPDNYVSGSHYLTLEEAKSSIDHTDGFQKWIKF